MIKKLLIATMNVKKLKEINNILGNTVSFLEQLPSDALDVIEDGATFLDNAKIKAYAYYNIYNIPTLADDSGLCVKCLENAPGVFSARYANTDDERIEKLLYNMRDVKNKIDREAYFNTTLVLVLTNDFYVTVEGRVYGEILTQKVGENGFGYDPVFLPRGYNKTFGEMSFEEKNKISHRSLALKNLKVVLDSIHNK